MIAADTSSFVAYFSGEAGPDVDQLGQAIAAGSLALPPPVLTELLTDPNAALRIERLLGDLPMLPLSDGYWIRAGESRRLLKRHGFKAKVADTLIAQACIDADVALIARDRDFRAFARHCGLKLA